MIRSGVPMIYIMVACNGGTYAENGPITVHLRVESILTRYVVHNDNFTRGK